MKTIRDYINLVENAQSQVDEMDRRDFLKGAGAVAAVGAAGAGYNYLNRGLKVATSGQDLQVAIIGLLYLYYVCKTLQDNPEAEKYASVIRSTISQVIADNPDFKNYINEEYKDAVAWMSSGDYKHIKDKEQSVWATRDKTITHFNNVYREAQQKYSKGMKKDDEFSEGLSETSDEAIARIEALAKT